VAREYGFPSWPALQTEAERRRRLTESAARQPSGNIAGPPRPDALEERWSFGGAAAMETAAGVLSPRVLLIGPDHAALDALLMPSEEAQRRLAAPPWPAGSSREVRVRFAADAGHTMTSLAQAVIDDVTVTDDRETRYTLRSAGMDGRAPMGLHLRLDPIPPPDCGWLELRSQDGSASRLLPSARPPVRVSQLAPASRSPAEQGLSDQALFLMEDQLSEDRPADGLSAGWSSMLNAAQLTDGPRHHLDVAAALPPVNDTVAQIDSLISEPESWRVYLRASPGWWTYSEDRDRKWAVISVDAEDNLGGRYVNTFGGSTGHSHYEDLVLRFRPRLDPLAQALTLTFSGAGVQVAIEIRLLPASQPELE
jgi:hypothetical protein